MSRKESFYETIVRELRCQMKDVKTNAHYTKGDFTPSQAAQYALSCAIGLINTEYESRKLGLKGFSKIKK